MSAQPVVTKPDPAQTAPATARRRRGARLTGLTAYPLMYFGVIAGVLPLLTLVVIGAPILVGVLLGAGEAEWVDGFSRVFGFILLFLTPPFGAWVWGYVALGVVAFLGGIALSLRILRRHCVRRAGAVTHWGMWATVPLQLVFAAISLFIIFGAIASVRADDASGLETVRAFGQGVAIATVVNLFASAGLGALIFPAVQRAVKAEKSPRRSRRRPAAIASSS